MKMLLLIQIMGLAASLVALCYSVQAYKAAVRAYQSSLRVWDILQKQDLTPHKFPTERPGNPFPPGKVLKEGHEPPQLPKRPEVVISTTIHR